jgi:hypothetical protein
VDEVKITKPSLSQHFQYIHPQLDSKSFTETPKHVQHLSSKPPNSKSFTETPDRIKSGLAGQCPAQPDNVQILNLGPMARFLREIYIYLHTSNGSLSSTFDFSC